jgi:hypothetical protein
MTTVEFTADNAMKCRCGACPVQTSSACVADKNAKLAAQMEAGMEAMPQPSDVPGLYCGTGVATCDDLDPESTCICASCPVFAENGLDGWKYCVRGDASSVS